MTLSGRKYVPQVLTYDDRIDQAWGAVACPCKRQVAAEEPWPLMRGCDAKLEIRTQVRQYRGNQLTITLMLLSRDLCSVRDLTQTTDLLSRNVLMTHSG
jgi:hypothetical protein